MGSKVNGASTEEAVNDADDAEITNGAASIQSENMSVAKQTALCAVCHTNPSKYKCPRCRLPYCSVQCNKEHRDNHPPDPEPETTSVAENQPSNAAPVGAKAPPGPFGALESSEKLQYLFKKYPCLPSLLRKIYAATQPPAEAPSSKAAIPASLLKGLPAKKDAWNHDMGIRNGKDVLRKARQEDSEEGEAIREYSELILHIIGSRECPDGEEMLRQQLAEQDADLIRRLMEQEKS